MADEQQAVGAHNSECVVFSCGGRLYGIVQDRRTLAFGLIDVAARKPVLQGEHTDLCQALAKLQAGAN